MRVVAKRSLVIKGKSVLAVVSAVSGCKTLARRDSRMLAGKPLFAWIVDAGRSSRLLDRMLIVTDDNEVRSYSQAVGMSVLLVARPKESGTETAASIASVALAQMPDFDYVVVLEAGSPLLLGSDIDGVLDVSSRNQGTPVVTVSETRVTPASLVTLDGGRGMRKVFGNQDPVPPNTRIYTTNNAISASTADYVRTHNTFLTEDTHAYIIPPERSLIIESKADLVIAEGFLKLTGPAAGVFNSGPAHSQTRQ